MKNLKKTVFYLSFLMIAIATTGCLTYKEVKVIKVTEFGIKEFTAKGVEVEVAMQIKNPNNYKINIVDSDLELFVKESRIGTATIDNKVTLPKKSNQIHRFIIKSSLKDMGSSIFPILMSVMGGGTIDLQVKGDIKATAKGIGKRFPVDFREKVKL